LDTRVNSKVLGLERVQCPNCGTIYPKPIGPLAAYNCARCGYSPLVPLQQTSVDKQATLAVLGAIAGAAVGGLPGAIVGGIVGLLSGSDK
jgi:outer membrane lipoprotein SlyB